MSGTVVKIGTAVYCDSGTIEDVAGDAVAWRKHLAGAVFVMFNGYAIEVFELSTAKDIVGEYIERTTPKVRP